MALSLFKRIAIGKDEGRFSCRLRMNALNDSIRRSYDEFPYISSAFGSSAPEHLRAVAHVFGVSSARPHRARVLELGCAAGGNLLPFAARWPGAEATGIDLSPAQIATGQAAATAMGLENVRLLEGDLSQLDEELGQFDYIVAHGVYSWVPAEVRESLLRICREHLAPDGLAYISYNVYPGWKSREVIRDAMLLDNHRHNHTADQLTRAREMIEFLHRSAPQDGLLRRLLDEQLDTIRHGRPHYLAHEYLEICNAPCYFRQFTDACAGHSLSYVAEAEISSMFPANYGLDPGEPALRARSGDTLALEQLLDFVNHRSFRQSILCHADRGDGTSRYLRRDRLRELHLAGRFEEDSQRPQRWRADNGGWVQTRDQGDRWLLRKLHEAWPASLPVEQLLMEVGTDMGNPLPAQHGMLAFIEELISIHALRFRLEPVLASDGLTAGPFPRAPAALRRLAAWKVHGAAPISLFNAWHESVLDIHPFEQKLLSLLNGHRDRSELQSLLADAPGTLARVSQPLVNRLDEGLAWLGHRAMLETS